MNTFAVLWLYNSEYLTLHVWGYMYLGKEVYSVLQRNNLVASCSIAFFGQVVSVHIGGFKDDLIY